MRQKLLQYRSEHELHRFLLEFFHAGARRQHDNHYGPKIYTNFQRMVVVFLFRRSGLPLRRFVDRLREELWPRWLGLRELPSKSSLHDWCDQYDMGLLRKLNRELLRLEQPRIMSIDGTGIDAWQRSRHYEKRVEAEALRYVKLDIFIDVDTHLIHDWVLRTQPRHDFIGARIIFKRMWFREILIIADKGYDAEELHRIVHRKGNRLYAPVRERPRKRIRGWHRQRCAAEGCEDYGLRSNVESTIFSIKAVRCRALRSKKAHMRKREMAWYIFVHNVEIIIRNSGNMKRFALQVHIIILDKP